MAGATLLNDLLARVTDVGRALALVQPDAGPAPEALAALCARLVGGRGEASGLALARAILDRYAALDATQRATFFGLLAARFGVDRARLDAAAARWRETPDDASARALHDAAEPLSQELIRRLNRAPGGARELVALRADLLERLAADPALAGLDADFLHLFGSWFNRGFLRLRRINWSSPAAVLEKIIAHEAVHEIQGWDDLRRRVAAPDRRLYAFFHPALEDDPLIFVEVALTVGMPSAIGPILAAERAALAPPNADTATFYSISNCQKGLRGVSFGNFLIKQVVEELRAELPGLTAFVTLSPVPGLRAWAQAQGLAPDLPDWGAIAAQAGPLAALTARYLLEGRRAGGGPVDAVARFHLGNGARLERINPCADPSPRGVKGSWGVMVNYLYDLDRIEKNHEAFAEDGTVAAAPAVRRLLKAR